MSTFTIAGIQIDCHLMDKPANLAAIRGHLRTAAARGARLAIFPECITTGYGFTSKDEAWPHGEPIPGPTTDALAAMCREILAQVRFNTFFQRRRLRAGRIIRLSRVRFRKEGVLADNAF